jgi:deazaflavin-dependent oxidoreductase (nitroreductase family)
MEGDVRGGGEVESIEDSWPEEVVSIEALAVEPYPDLESWVRAVAALHAPMTPLLGRRVARFNSRVTNRITRPLARRLPGFGVVEHSGRRSGRRYRTPVNVFRTGPSYVIALTYGVESEWVKNVLAAGGCELVMRGRRQRLTAPAIVHDESRRLVPPPVRPVLRLLRVADFLRLEDAGSPLSQ